ncbi:O-methyltransferase [Virgibacillus alimentarius]|uniref:tRNA 5-hydroxyuridine methyltransferase n=2 Tax=Virgibacillus alimentarius TaxID=698769 RepID=A0ABS4S522_9BACI|nr:O-methyltransferase [Virgibacillus alimentarius]MBP2256589.1 putative O-methyltransferase YrrM [Virgibacillus alimentarius]
MDEYLLHYISKTLPAKAEWVKEIEKKAKEDNVPIMDEISIEFLMQLIRLSKPNKILEIGSAIGYSALRMQEAYPKTKITTIERDENRVQQAIKNIEKSHQSDNIHVIHGDALNEINNLAARNEQFDVIFIDAAKGQYKRFFELSSSLIKPTGLIITDNVLFKGLVANPNRGSSRLDKIAKKIHAYNEWLVNHHNFTTSIVPIGDGVAISIKK